MSFIQYALNMEKKSQVLILTLLLYLKKLGGGGIFFTFLKGEFLEKGSGHPVRNY